MNWYAVFCKPRQEAIAEENLRRQDFDVYLPRISVTHRRRGKWADVIEALFPRYLFIQIDPQKHSTSVVRSTRGAIDMVRFGDRLAMVPKEIIDVIKQQEDAATENLNNSQPLFNPGTPVKIVGGAFLGVNAIFNEHDGTARVIVLLELLGKINRVKINRDWVVQSA